MRCWGNNVVGQLGDGTRDARLAPVAVRRLAGVAQVAAGQQHACAVLVDGTVRCWGDNTGGALGDGVVPRAGR